jgi:hypothetical protein
MLSSHVRIAPQLLPPPRACHFSAPHSTISLLTFAVSSSSFFPSLFKKNVSLTPLFSFSLSCSFALFFTLAEISPVFATLTQSALGVPPPSPPNRNYSSYSLRRFGAFGALCVWVAGFPPGLRQSTGTPGSDCFLVSLLRAAHVFYEALPRCFIDDHRCVR